MYSKTSWHEMLSEVSLCTLGVFEILTVNRPSEHTLLNI